MSHDSDNENCYRNQQICDDLHRDNFDCTCEPTAADRLEEMSKDLRTLIFHPLDSDQKTRLLSNAELLRNAAELVRTMNPDNPDFSQEKIWDAYRKLQGSE